MLNLYKLGWIAAFWIAGNVCVLSCSAQSTSSSQDSAAKPADAKSRVQSHDSVTVTATYTPEEKEDWKINEVYQPIFSLEQKGDCETAIQRYKSEVISLAEQSKFERPKKKFLSLATEGIGNCYMNQGRYADAEKCFRENTNYLQTGDSSYPINFRQIGVAQMAQQHWEAAEESIKTSLPLFDSQIDRDLKSENEFSRSEGVGNLHGSKARSLAYLAVVYLREGRTAKAAETVELAYSEATQPNVPAKFVNEIVMVGRSIAAGTGDEDAVAKWSQRKPPEE